MASIRGVKKEKFLLIDERVTYIGNKDGEMLPQRMRRVRAKIEKNRFAHCLTDRGFRVSFYWQRIRISPKRVVQQSRTTIYWLDQVKVNSQILPLNSPKIDIFEGAIGFGASYHDVTVTHRPLQWFAGAPVAVGRTHSEESMP